MRKVPALILVASIAALSACSGGGVSYSDSIKNGTAANGDLSGLRNFSGVATTGPDNVIVTVGPAFKVVAEGDPKVLERVAMVVEDGTLTIGRKKSTEAFWGTSGVKGATIRVAMPSIKSAALTGSGDMRIDTATGPQLALSLTGSGDLTLGSGKVDSLKADITGSGGMTLAGTANQTALSATGSGDIDAAALNAGGAKIDVMGSGDVSLTSGGAVSIDIMGSGNAEVRGGAQCKIAIMGSGEANCKD